MAASDAFKSALAAAVESAVKKLEADCAPPPVEVEEAGLDWAVAVKGNKGWRVFARFCNEAAAWDFGRGFGSDLRVYHEGQCIAIREDACWKDPKGEAVNTRETRMTQGAIWKACNAYAQELEDAGLPEGGDQRVMDVQVDTVRTIGQWFLSGKWREYFRRDKE